MRIDITPEAVDYVRRHSGVVYIWASESGFLQTDVEAPKPDGRWEEHDVEGVAVRIAPSAPGAVEWRIGFRSLPHARLIAVWNGTPGGTTSGTTGLW